mgnify:CR=1 FL=1
MSSLLGGNFMNQEELLKILVEAERAESESYAKAITKYLSVIAHSLLIEEDDWLEEEGSQVGWEKFRKIRGWHDLH